jgi:hypothetical protein
LEWLRRAPSAEAGCASVQLDPQPQVATTLAPFNAQKSRLLAASVDGKPAFCTIQPAWFALGEPAPACPDLP